jgi:hypothetical protein
VRVVWTPCSGAHGLGSPGKRPFFRFQTFSPLTTAPSSAYSMASTAHPPAMRCPPACLTTVTHPTPHPAPISRRTRHSPPRPIRLAHRGHDVQKRHHHPIATRRSPVVALDVPLNSSLLAIIVPHQVGHGCRRRRVLSVSGVSDFCFKYFVRMLQK